MSSASSKNLTPKTKLLAARGMIRERNPYFGSLINGATYVWLPKGALQTMGVSNTGVVFLDEADIERLTVEQVALSLLHELAGHWLRDHHGRMPGGADARTWNLAGDCEINDDLKAAGWPTKDFPGGLVLPENYKAKDGLTVEQYYGIIRQDEAKNKKQSKGNEPGCGHGWCGSGAGRPLPQETDAKGNGQDGQGQGAGGAPGRSQGEVDRIRKQVAQDIKNHEKSYGRGSVPGGWSRWADDFVKPPKVNWKSKLSQLVRDACAYRPGAVVTNWRAFGRRQAALGFGPGRPMVPQWRNPVPTVAVAIDTSGSMGSEELSLAASELDGILKSIMADVEFVAIDAAIHSTIKIRQISDLATHLKGGGGTDFRPAFEHFSKPRPGKTKPEVIIFLTDGDGPAPSAPPPGLKVIWVLVGSHAVRPYTEHGKRVDWGNFIKIPTEGDEAQEV